ncbi:MAG: S8 family serine peptidase [Caldilineaceae bacterium]
MTNINTNGYPEGGATYYYANGQRVPLVRDPQVLALKVSPGREELSPEALDVIRTFKDREMLTIPQYGIKVYDTSIQERAIRVLRNEAAVEMVTPAFRQTPQSPDLIFVTNRIVVQFKAEVSQEQIQATNAQYGAEIVEKLSYAPNGYILQLPKAEDVIATANAYYESGLTEFAHPDFIKRRHWRGVATIAEPCTQLSAPPLPTPVSTETRGARSSYLSEQWHLTTAKVVDAWNVTRGNTDIRVAIMDDGVDVGHPEFSSKVVLQHNFETGANNGNPMTDADKHGTACAGVAIAAGVKAYGSAPGCSLMAIRTPDYLGVADEANMFSWAADNGADVISCSWGPPDGYGTNDPLPDSTRVAIDYCVTHGRSGKGIPIFWAAGNGNESVMLDGYASNPNVIAVAASTDGEAKAWYSDVGAAVWICAPSNGGSRAIFTTDRRGSMGYNRGDATLGDAAGDYTNDFGGTSSATPLAAGIAALMLSVNGDLSWRDVKTILAETADKIGGAASYDSSGHSNSFGYGRVNALAAVQRAQNGGGTQPGAGPTISGPQSISRSDGAPTFQCNPRPNTYYAVEVATDYNLFGGGNRTDSNFYATYSDTPLLSTPTYRLPESVWGRLKNGARLYYRMWTSSSPSDWVNYAVTTPSANPQSAPFITISGGGTQPGTGPFISGPQSAGRAEAAPVFQCNPQPNTYYAVEVATDYSLFGGGNRTESNFYGSYSDTALLSAPTYRLPENVWSRLKSGNRLYYRMWTSSSPSDWVDYAVTTPSANPQSAPFIEIGDTIRTVRSARFAQSTLVRQIDEAHWRRDNG